MSTPGTAVRLHRLRWAVRVVLALGVAASVIANILHAVDNPISQTIAAWPPVALLLTVELISRVPVHGRALAAVRIIATTAIAGIAAWASYWHMVGVAARYGETGATAYLLPLSVDGLIVVASICLVELSGQLNATTTVDPAADPLDEPLDDLTDEPWPDPWLRAVPAQPEPIRELPAEPAREPVRPSRVSRSTTPLSPGAKRVIAAHRREPDASNERLAVLAKVSVSTVKRNRPARELAATGTENR